MSAEDYIDPEILHKLRDKAFDRIEEDARSYAGSRTARALFLQGTLFDITIDQRHVSEDLAARDKLAKADPESILLFPRELRELRLRAAFYGAGLMLEPYHLVPTDVAARLSDNLENYLPQMRYEQLVIPWIYRFRPDDLQHIFEHDFRIAAEDSADGDIARIWNSAEELVDD